MPGLLNYSTKIPYRQSVGEIMGLLARLGAERTSITNNKLQQPVALEFVVATNHGERAYRLPARPRGVLMQMEQTWASPQRPGGMKSSMLTPEHAWDVAWRILKDWVEAQVALIEIGMSQVDEVLLPYMLTEGNQTMWELYENTQRALPPGQRSIQIFESPP